MLTWRPSYSVGDALLDSQHKRLLGLCNEAVRCAESKDKVTAGLEYHLILNDLMKYAVEHFDTEEQILEHYHYPLLEEQKSEHLEYFEKITELLMGATVGELDMSGLNQFISTWWVSHILVSDMQYSEFLRMKS